MTQYDVQVTEQFRSNARNFAAIARRMRETGITHPTPEDVELYVVYAVEAHAEIKGVRKLAFSGVSSRLRNDWCVEPEFADADGYNDNDFTNAWDIAYETAEQKERDALATIMAELGRL